MASFLTRARKQEVAHLKKRVKAIEQRISDMKTAAELMRKQIAEHEAEIAKLEAE